MVDSKFKMSKKTLFNIVNKLKPLITKKDTLYRFTIPIEVKVACVIHKLSHVLTSNELFAIGTSIVGLVIHEVVKVVNIMFKSL
jgi:hypothetical protein